MKSFKDFINEQRGLYVNYYKPKNGDGTYERRVRRDQKPVPGMNLGGKHSFRMVTKAKQEESKHKVPNGPVSQQAAEEIAMTHGFNLATMDENGKRLRGTNPPEILLPNPNKRSPFPYIKKII